ncbi:MAG: LuxR C-terminal-related transcriptional regulator [Prevotellaceae bacterium]|nr:LuxR C-terminal-related transcriptional regulator [Prevotellaceae bacterium]
MLKDKHIIIISTDFPQAYGLKALLEEYFSSKNVEILNDLSSLENHSLHCNVLFLQAEVLFVFFDKLSTMRNKLIVISNGSTNISGNIPVLKTSLEQTAFLDLLSDLLEEKLDQQKSQNSKASLSDREQEVLTLIAKGEMNKTIADKLNISLNTVLTHRKNITAKLNIKTVSGLTVYAILNGLISADEI